MATEITLNLTAPEIGLFEDVENAIHLEDCFKGKVQAESLNFQVYVMMGADTPDARLDKIQPKKVKMIDFHPHVQYKKQWFPLTGIPANACDFKSLLPAIIIGY